MRGESIAYLFWCLLCFGAVLPAHAAEGSADDFFVQTLGDLREELHNAREQNKKAIFLFFEMDECPFCARMKQTVFSRADVQKYYRGHFLTLPIDIEGDTELVDFEGNSMTSKAFSTKIHRVRATPVMMFFDLDGKPLYRHTGPTRNAEEFLSLGEYILSGEYQKMKFSTYRRQKQKQ